MLKRHLIKKVRGLLRQSPAVLLLGPRQVGKTTLARLIAEERPSVYLDLESERDRAKLADPENYLLSHQDKLVVLDEVHRMPNIFRVLRGLIDEGIRAGYGAERFLLLGSASLDLLRQSDESLAGRVAHVELSPFDVLETGSVAINLLWQRGGFPRSFLAEDDEESMRWRRDFLQSYLERDLPQFGLRIPAETLRRFITMLAHHQCGLLNAATLARNLAVNGKTIAHYLDLLVDLFIVRRLSAWHANIGKRLIKSPKISIRDSGLLHALLSIVDNEELMSNPIVGASWESFVIENILRAAPDGTEASFYRSATGDEIDLILDLSGKTRFAIEIKLGGAPSLSGGFYRACEVVHPDKCFVVYGGTERYTLDKQTEAIGLTEFLEIIADVERVKSKAHFAFPSRGGNIGPIPRGSAPRMDERSEFR